MSDWEPFDDELARALRRRAGAESHDPLATASAHRAVLDRASGIRRRRAAIAGSGTLTVLLLAGLLVLNTGGGDDDAVGTATDATIGSSLPTTPSTSSTPSTSEPQMATAPGTTVLVPTSTPTSSVPGYPPETESPTTVLGTIEPGPTTSTSSTSDWPPGEYTWDADGGSLTIFWDGAGLRLVSVDPKSGITAEIHDNTTERIRIDFGDGSRIECRVDNGQLALDIT
jgi:hypothetical protein